MIKTTKYIISVPIQLKKPIEMYKKIVLSLKTEFQRFAFSTLRFFAGISSLHFQLAGILSTISH